MATVSDLLVEGTGRLRTAGSETARLDTELLLGHVVGIERTAIIAHPDAPVGEGQVARFRALLERRETGEPVAYIRGVKEFRGLAFGTDARALIPRPETERLIDLGEVEIQRRLTSAPRPRGTPRIRVADVGTGSGAVAIALAVALRRRGMLDDVELAASDVSEAALQLARENAVAHAVGDRISFEEADLLPARVPEGWDLVLANLPYVRSASMASLPPAATFEPSGALDGGKDGLAVIRRLLDELPGKLAPDGLALIEIGADQATEMTAAVHARLPGWRCEVERDLGGLPRVARVDRP